MGGELLLEGPIERTQNELRALGTLAFDELRRFPGGLRDIHLGVASRAFSGVGPFGAPARLLHDGISRGAYGAIASGAALAGRATDRALERNGVGEDVALSHTRPGAALIAFVNGLIGDDLERSGSALHQPASMRLAGRPSALDPAALRDAFPDATPRLAVFLHGLMETEFSWRWGADETYGERLANDLGFTAVELRYNSGLHISESGREVGALLEQLVASWPVEVERIALVGHSMGGLVARSAGHQAAAADARWVDLVREIACLGTPHLGAPLEQGVHAAAAALSRLPETRPFGAFLRRRSAGIRDLRHGSLIDEDWRGRDPDELRAAAAAEVPLLPGVTHFFVSASVTASPRHPLGLLLGDLLVLVPSATGRGRTRRIPFELEHGHHVSPAHHFALLNHPEVYARLREWLSG